MEFLHDLPDLGQTHTSTHLYTLTHAQREDNTQLFGIFFTLVRQRSINNAKNKLGIFLYN